MNTLEHILLIEDDPSFGYILSEYLQMQDFKVSWKKSSEEGLIALEKYDYDLAILDIMLPKMNGFEFASHIKSKYPSLPFIFLSAKSLKIDKLKGFKVGAYDYVTKPVDEELLVAKIKALLTHKKITISEEDQKIGAYDFKPSIKLLAYGEEVVKLTKRESDLLLLLNQHQNKLLTRKKALKSIWGSTDEFSRKSMDVFISKLRKYLAKDINVKIENLHGQGFILNVRS